MKRLKRLKQAKRRFTTNPVLLGTCVALTAVAAVACVDLSAPAGAASISPLILPSLFVVQGDVMRDSTGNPAKPTIIAYDQNGNPLSGITPRFFLTDSIPHAHFDPATGIIHGDSLGIAHIVGQIGNLQTAVFSLPVTLAPDTMVRVLVGGGDTLRATVTNDSATSRGQLAAQVRVTGGGANHVPIQGVRVAFTLVHSFASRTSSPAVFLADDSGNLSQLDTTDATGLASRRVTIVSSFLADQTLFSRVDSVEVRATASYRGVSLPGSPVHIVIPVKISF